MRNRADHLVLGSSLPGCGFGADCMKFAPGDSVGIPAQPGRRHAFDRQWNCRYRDAPYPKL
jgi:hypothetical protein